MANCFQEPWKWVLLFPYPSSFPSPSSSLAPPNSPDLLVQKEKLAAYIPKEAVEYYIESSATETHLKFPVLQYPEKVKSLNIVKSKTYAGRLKGIKGQYFIFEDNTVFNIRANEGLVVSLQVS